MNIAVIGSGYVGLVTAAVFAEIGNRVVGVDINEERVARLCRGESPIFEPGLDDMLQRNISAGRISFTTDTAAAVHECKIIFIAVGTPPAPDGSTDLSQVKSAAKAIAMAAPAHRIVVNKSTVPVGTGAIVLQILQENAGPEASFDVLSNPEFLREGTAISDAMHPDRIIIGSSSPTSAQYLIDLYKPLDRSIVCTDIASAEMIKYASNAFLATKIAFINDIADLCEEVGADVRMVAAGMGCDNRIGKKFLNAGIGYGGSCFPKDVESLISVARLLGRPSALLEAVSAINSRRVPHFIERLNAQLDGISGKTITVLGLTFKPDTDDLRESRPLDLCRQLLEAGATVQAHDPIAMTSVAKLLPDVTFCENPLAAATGADAVILATEWQEYGKLDLAELQAIMRGNLLADGRNFFDGATVQKCGLRYMGVGLKSQPVPATENL
ncbi:MAG TPA: UDP-glucose/GDP-mannose dehydrogenase family protein [Armatimonadota bacterium]|nr:UDP-glucose/GDP-mannose dehydrogenase family protein [Armatimonadota bacterium]